MGTKEKCKAAADAIIAGGFEAAEKNKLNPVYVMAGLMMQWFPGVEPDFARIEGHAAIADQMIAAESAE